MLVPVTLDGRTRWRVAYPSAIGPSWRGENRVQISHIPNRVSGPRENHSLAGNKSMELDGNSHPGGYWLRLACDVRGP